MRLATAFAVASFTLVPFAAMAQELVLTEIMYNSAGAGSDDVEYVEILNTSTTPIDLSLYYVLDDTITHGPVALNGSIEPCGVWLVSNNNAAFVLKYGAGLPLNTLDMDSGPWGLGNGGDEVRLYRRVGAAPDPLVDVLVDFVAFDDGAPWPIAADGTGPALELIDPMFDNTLAASWALTVVDGTPGVYTNCQPPVSVDAASWGEIKASYR